MVTQMLRQTDAGFQEIFADEAAMKGGFDAPQPSGGDAGSPAF
jgi:hypothetical protein